MRVLVTGAGGFLGGAIARRLVERGESVRSFSRRYYPGLDRLGIDQRRGDLVDAQAVLEACRGIELVFHVAAKAGVWGRRRDFFQTNVVGTRNVLEACRASRIDRLIYTSSPSVVFDGHDMEGVDETVPYPKHFKAAYPETKAAAERLVLSANGPALATISLRPHLIWGPGDTNLIPGILARSRKGGLRRIGTAKKLVDFTYIDNAADAHLCAADHLAPGLPAAGKAYFISQAEPVPIWAFVNRVLACSGLAPVEGSVPRSVAYAVGAMLEVLYRLLPVSGEPRLTRFLVEELSTAHWFDISAARRDLSYEPAVGMEEGFRRLEASLSK